MISQTQIYNASYIKRRFPIKYYLYSYAAHRDQRCERADLQDRKSSATLIAIAAASSHSPARLSLTAFCLHTRAYYYYIVYLYRF